MARNDAVTMTCTLDSLNAAGCWNCYSPTQLQTAFVWLLYKGYIALSGATEQTINAIVKELVCFTCAPGQLAAFKTQVAAQFAVAAGAFPGETADEITADIKTMLACTNCGTGTHELDAAELQVLCTLLKWVVENESQG